MKMTLKTFTCWGCGNCCRIPGYVEVAASDVDNMAAHLGVTPQDFAERYTVLAKSRRGLTLREQADGACVFLKPDGACAVYAARPPQCRDFPHKWRYPGWQKLCENSCSLDKKPQLNANSHSPAVGSK